MGFLNNRRRKLAAIAIVTMTIIAVMLAVQSWRVLTAIVDVEQAAVVPLPPSSLSESALVSTPAAEIASVAEGERSGATGSPMADVSIAQATPAATADDADSLSRLDVARQLVDAGLATGDPGKSEIWGGRTSLTILVLGVDRRPDGGDQNADVIILAHLDLLRHRLSAVSLPRDLEVEIPGIGKDKINSAYNHGVLAAPDDPSAGVSLVRDTVESLFGVPIDGYVLVDFEGFSSVVDAMGGISVDVPYAIDDDEYPTEDYGIQTIHFDPGVQDMNGDQALIYVRTRHADSDDGRRQRQLDVIRAIFEKGKSLESIANAEEIILSAGSVVQTSFDLEEQLTLARLAMSMDEGDIQLAVLGEPILSSDWDVDGRWIYTGDPASIRSFVLEAIRTDYGTPSYSPW